MRQKEITILRLILAGYSLKGGLNLKLAKFDFPAQDQN